MLIIDFRMVKGCVEEKVQKENTKAGRYDYAQAHHSEEK